MKRLVFKTVPDATTRMAMLRRGEIDAAYDLDAPNAADVKRDPKVKLAFSGGIGTTYLDFLQGQWDTKSPWSDQRVRLAASLAIDRRSISEAETLGASIPTASIGPREFDFVLALEPHPHDPARARQLMVQAGYPNGFDGGDLIPTPPYFDRGEMVAGYLGAIGIKLDDLHRQQDVETDVSKREALLHRIQRIVHERVIIAPLFLYVWPSGIGPRVQEPGLMLINPYPWSAPYEEVRLKKS